MIFWFRVAATALTVVFSVATWVLGGRIRRDLREISEISRRRP